MAAFCYRLLLRLYPASFRAEYEKELTGVFEHRCRQQRSGAGRAACWAEGVLDVFVNAPAVHWDILRQDLRGVGQTLRRAPGYSLTVVLVAALGIGATTAAFSLADHVLIRPLPFPEADRLVRLWQDQSAFGYARMELSPPNFRTWQRDSRSFAGMSAYQGGNSLFLRDPSGGLARIDGATTIGDVFGVLRIRPLLGRTLSDEDDSPGAPAVILLSDELWRTRFEANAALLAIAGVALGSVLAFVAGSAMRALLAGVSPMDPLTLAGAVLLAVAMTLSGTLLPTLRAVRVDPIS